jgi:homopolymeric O-antigen transport system ATP-binding protein
MRRVVSAAEAAALPADVIIRVDQVTRALPPPAKALPRWIVRILPKSGLAGRSGDSAQDLLLDDEDDEDDDDEREEDEEAAVLHEISFDVGAGRGLGILCDDRNTLVTLVRIIIGAVPPTTGRVLVRGLMAGISHREIVRLVTNTTGRQSAEVVAKYFHWPLDVIDRRWDEIEAFAALDELERMPAGKRRRLTSTRLAISAALHMDATAYLVDQSIHYDPGFGVRCLELLAQRKDEGAAVIQAARRIIEDVVRLCPDDVMWIEAGKETYRGTPVFVATQVHDNVHEKVLEHHVPVTAALADEAHLVELGAAGSYVDFELQVVRPSLELGFALDLTDGHGKVVHWRKPDPIPVLRPGVYRLRATLPPGLLEPTSYRAQLMAEVAIQGNEPAPPRELLSFDVSGTQSDGTDDADDAGDFALVPLGEEEDEQRVGSAGA